MNRALLVCLFASVVSLLASGAVAQPGWTPEILSPEAQAEHYLPDFSYAGYRWGETPIPSEFPDHVVIDVRDYGAIPNDDGDDTAALQEALQAANATEGPVVVQLPAGRLILTGILQLERSDLVLRGAGSGDGGTTLYMPKPLAALDAPEITREIAQYLVENDKRQRERDRGIDEPFSLYSWSGGFVWINTPGGRGKPYLSEYDREPTTLARGLSGVRDGHFITAIGDIEVAPGDLVQINWFNRHGEDGSLIEYLYGGHQDSLRIGERHWESPDMPLTRQEVTVTRVNGNVITIKEPLLHDMRPEWTPTITAWDALTEVGVEGIRFEFLFQEYNIHHVEPGNNAVYVTNAAHSWVRDVTVVNGDSGVLTDVCSNITVEDVEIYGRKYHYGVHMGDCYSVLAKDLYVAAPVVHTFSFNTGSRRSVYAHSTATGTPVLDQHSGLNIQNLFDDITLHIDDPEHQPIAGGGAGYWKPSHAAYPVFWNVGLDFLYPDPGGTTMIKGLSDGPEASIIGLHANRPLALTYGPAPYIEGLGRGGIGVPSLYLHQLRQRLRAQAAP